MSIDDAIAFESFSKLLDRIAEVKISDEDYNLLATWKKHLSNSDDQERFKNAVYLLYHPTIW